MRRRGVSRDVRRIAHGVRDNVRFRWYTKGLCATDVVSLESTWRKKARARENDTAKDVARKRVVNHTQGAFARDAQISPLRLVGSRSR